MRYGAQSQVKTAMTSTLVHFLHISLCLIEQPACPNKSRTEQASDGFLTPSLGEVNLKKHLYLKINSCLVRVGHASCSAFLQLAAEVFGSVSQLICLP